MTTETQTRQPTHRLYSVKGEGFSIKLDVVPLDGHIVMRAPKAKDGGQQ